MDVFEREKCKGWRWGLGLGGRVEVGMRVGVVEVGWNTLTEKLSP